MLYLLTCKVEQILPLWILEHKILFEYRNILKTKTVVCRICFTYSSALSGGISVFNGTMWVIFKETIHKLNLRKFKDIFF